MVIALILAATAGFTDVDTELKPNNLELDLGSYLYHWDRSEDWVEGFENNYIGLQYSDIQANVYGKVGTFTNSFGDRGAVTGAGFYFDDTGRYKQGAEAGLTWGYKRGEGEAIFFGYAGRLDITNTVKLKVHANPQFGGFVLAFDL